MTPLRPPSGIRFCSINKVTLFIEEISATPAICARIPAAAIHRPTPHASKHFLATDHPLARSIEPGEPWIWCYRDNIVASEIET
jgi:hypothetical protein